MQAGDETYHLVKVLDQKGLRTGKCAVIPFEQMEYSVLKLFITKLRPLLSIDPTVNVAFPACTQLSNTADKELSFSAIGRILGKFRTSSGVKMSTRVLRHSKVTNSRAKNINTDQRREIAEAMNHSLETANRYYNFTSANSSVVKTIEFHHLSTTDESTEFCDSEHESSTPSQPMTSTPLKRKADHVNTEAPDQANETIKVLRNKKIKRIPLNQSGMNKVKDAVRTAVNALVEKGETKLLRFGNGNIRLQAITKSVPKEILKMVDTNTLKGLAEEQLRELSDLSSRDEIVQVSK